MATRSKFAIESWINTLPTQGSLEQLEDCFLEDYLLGRRRFVPTRNRPNEGISIALPASLPSSVQLSHGDDPSGAGDIDSQSADSHDTAIAPDGRHEDQSGPGAGNGSLPTVARDDNSTRSATMYTASVGPSWRAQNAPPATEIGVISLIDSIADVPLPDATPSEIEWLNDNQAELASDVAAFGSSGRRRKHQRPEAALKHQRPGAAYYW